MRYIDPDGEAAWEKTVDVANTVTNAVTYFHFEGRDAKNIITESFDNIMDSSENGGDWTLLPDSMSVYHQNGKGDSELKFICNDGREAVFSKDDSPDGSYQLVTDPKYKGTYNYCNPSSPPTLPTGITDFKGMGKCFSESIEFVGKAIGHFFADMLPYYATGCKNERNQ